MRDYEVKSELLSSIPQSSQLTKEVHKGTRDIVDDIMESIIDLSYEVQNHVFHELRERLLEVRHKRLANAHEQEQDAREQIKIIERAIGEITR